MEKRNKRGTKKRDRRRAGRGQVPKRSVKVESQSSKPVREEVEVTSKPAKRSCFDCVFCVSSLLVWARTLMSGFPIGGVCANHWETPGRMRPIPGEPCRNFWAKTPPPLRLEPPAPPNDKIRYIPLTRGLFAIVDVEDYEWLNQYKWHASHRHAPYACRSENHKIIMMHRMIMRPPKGKVVDHINGNGLDNRRCNLRICGQDENMRNSRPHAGGKCEYRGVFPRGDQWEAKVTCKGKTHYLGRFDDKVEAAKARDRKARELFGKYAWLNFPLEDPERANNRDAPNPVRHGVCRDNLDEDEG